MKSPWCSGISRERESAAPGQRWICVLRWNCDERFFCWADDDGAKLGWRGCGGRGLAVSSRRSMRESCRGQSTPGGLLAACRCCRCCWLLRVVGGWWLEVCLARPWSASAGKKGEQEAGEGSVKAQRGFVSGWCLCQGRWQCRPGEHGEIDNLLVNYTWDRGTVTIDNHIRYIAGKGSPPGDA